MLIACNNKGSDQENYKYHVASWQGVNVSSERYKGAIKKSRNVIIEANRSNGLPGAQIAVAVDGEICWSENFGFADLEQGIPIKANTIFRMASVSKILTAAAVGKLVEEGKLDLDTPVINYLPELPRHYEAITTRHLVSHQSGIRHYYGADRSSKKEHYDNVNEVLELFVNSPLLYEPGTKCSYSSYGWIVISAIIQRISGKPFLRYMEEEIWQAMRLNNTFGQIPATRLEDVTKFYLKKSARGNWREAAYEDLSFKWAGGGLSSNANDLALFGNELLNGKFFAKSTIDLMFTPQLTSTKDTTGFGIGFIFYHTRDKQMIIGHGGFMPTARSYLMLFPESNVVIAFTTNTAMINFADENIVAIANNFIKEKNDENYFLFDRTLYSPWLGLWHVEIENTDGEYENVYFNFFEDHNDLKGIISFKDKAPRHLEVVAINTDSIQLLATLRSHTATLKLAAANGRLSGKSYYDKPLTHSLKKQLISEREIARRLAPRDIRNGKRIY